VADVLQVLFGSSLLSQSQESDLKPTISMYTEEASKASKRVEDFVNASFWIGVDYAEHDLKSVKIDIFDAQEPDGATDLQKFVSLLLGQQIDYSVRFFGESSPSGETEEEEAAGEPAEEPPKEEAKGAAAPAEAPAPASKGVEDDAAELERLKDDFNKGVLSKRQYEAKRDQVLKRWRQRVDEGLSR
jgi:hypothetical protein